MDLTFRGEYEYAVDDRGRMVIPPKFREALTDTVLIGRGAGRPDLGLSQVDVRAAFA